MSGARPADRPFRRKSRGIITTATLSLVLALSLSFIVHLYLDSVALRPLPVPPKKPSSNGSNWAIFKMHFSNAMKVMRRWAYFTRLSPYPDPIDPAKPTPEEATKIVQCEFEDSVASYLLSQRLSDTTEMHLINCTTTKERWDLVTKEYQAKSAYAQADLHQPS
ncbi:hypothetical protein BGY98DRAFT_1103985 [Russula aff. rugulosa BPL654]|nr:hypothetical protein BGY98DRAFT_1103985 [Russula aff. rugulosa BPL654]